MTASLNTPIYPVARHVRGDSEYSKWLSAYRLAIANATVFFIFSLLNSAFDNTPIAAHFIAAILFMAGSIFAFYRLCSAGGSLAAVSFYVLGTGLAFGFGTAYAMHAEGYVFQFLFSPADQAKNLPVINFINSLSVLIVLIFSWFVAKLKERSVIYYSLRDIFSMLQMFRMPAIILTGFYLVVFVSTFPVAKDFMIRNIVSQMRMMPILAVLLSFSMWGRLSISGRIIALVIAIVMMVFGVLEAGKTSVLYSILAMIGGLYFGRYHRIAAALVVVTAVFYFTVLSSGVSQIRGHWQYDQVDNSIEQRATIIFELVTGQSTSSALKAGKDTSEQLIRFAHAPYQSYLINEWRDGRPGASLADAWTALIPRFLWSDKPVITRFSTELYGQIYSQGAIGTSSQAPTYTAEALWNYGWPGLVVVSIFLGLELGWFTRKWLQFIHGRNTHLGIVVFAVPIAIYSFTVETWIAASYIGGFITLFILVRLADLLMPLIRWERSEKLQASDPRARLAT